MCLLPGRQGAENDRYNRYAIAGQFSMLMTKQCTAVHKNTSPDTHGQDMVIAGKLVLIGYKLPPTHACPQSPGYGLSTVGQSGISSPIVACAVAERPYQGPGHLDVY